MKADKLGGSKYLSNEADLNFHKLLRGTLFSLPIKISVLYQISKLTFLSKIKLSIEFSFRHFKSCFHFKQLCETRQLY